jgi:hypothetical protein
MNIDECTDTLPELVNTEELEKKARKLAAFSNSAATAGNTITVFGMLVLQKILEQQLVNPTANLANIILITDSIANLNSSINAAVV